VLSLKLNFETITKSLKKTPHRWSYRSLSLIGKFQIIKTFANSLTGDLFESACIKPLITGIGSILKGLYHSLSAEWKKLIVWNKREVPPKTTLSNGVEQSDVESLPSNKINHLFISKISKPTAAKQKFEEQYAFNELSLDWETIYLIPFQCTIDTKSRQFQYKVLLRILSFNDFFLRLGRVSLLSVLSALNRGNNASFVWSMLCGTTFLVFQYI